MARKQAVVVGALGIIGRYIVERLLRQDDWSVVGVSRRASAGAVDLFAHNRIRELPGGSPRRHRARRYCGLGLLPRRATRRFG